MANSGVGSPNCLLLDHWAALLYYIFDETPYMVGSACYSTDWRDVDVRVILDDEKYDETFGDSYAKRNAHSKKWSALMAALSLWGQVVTGLPIDFQVQRRSKVTEVDWEKRREPLGIFPCD